MDPTLSDEQVRARDTLQEYLEAEGGPELARQVMDGDEGVAQAVIEDLWAGLTEMDFTALPIAPANGGLGGDLVYLSAVLEIAGQVAMPGPYPETMAFAVPVLEHHRREDQERARLSAIASGDLTYSFALHDDATESVPEGIDLVAQPADGGYRLTGEKTLVPYGGLVDRLIVAVRDGEEEAGYEGISLVDVPVTAAEVTRADSLDRTRPMYRVGFDDVTVPANSVIATGGTAGAALRGAIDRYNVGISAMLVGGAQFGVDRSVEYATERKQFGNPIGMYQAVKHRIAEMWMDAQLGRSLVYYAAWAVSEDNPDAPRAVSAAKAFCSDHCRRIFGDDIRNHGGVGFTWDDDGHLFLKQATAWSNFLGSPTDHRRRVADERGY